MPACLLRDNVTVSDSPGPATDVTAVVLCGGESRRLGAGDKTQAELGNGTVLDALLRGLPCDWPVVAVGPRREAARQVAWAREDPPGGGPVAAIAAALDRVDTPLMVVVGGDMPFAGGTAAVLTDRLAADPSQEAVVGRDRSGRLQPLLTAYRTEALRRVLPSPAVGVPAMRLLDGLRYLVLEVADPAALDIDTPEELDEARRRLGP
jgi:molybdenum cofactor guanylyltransferase